MTVAGAVPAVASWLEPEGVAPRGTLVVLPGRGEHAGVYERFGRRISTDGYRVHAVADPTVDEQRSADQVRELLVEAAPRPVVLVGSDAGALFAVRLAAELPEVAGLVLAGLPTTGAELPETTGWADEVEARTACPTHQARLSGDEALRRGALSRAIPKEWFARATPAAVGVAVLGLHGADDVVSPIAAARDWYVDVSTAELVSIAGGRHDALNDQTHRTAAASVVLFLERLRLGLDVPAIARVEIAR